MSWISDPYTYSLTELQDVKKEETKYQNVGCAPNRVLHDEEFDAKSAGFGWPGNGEFVYDANGPGCSYCAWGRGKECGFAGIVGGGRPGVKRTAFLADSSACCWANNLGANTNKIVDGKTCDFNYREPTSVECIAVYRSHCTKDNNILDDAKCKALENSNATLYKSLMKDYCNSSNEKSLKGGCINWCKSNSTDCGQLNLLNDCVEYGICTNAKTCNTNGDCNLEKINDLKSTCEKRGLQSEQGLRLYGCSENSIELIEEECTEAGVDLSICAVKSLQDKREMVLSGQSLDIQQQAIEKSQQNYKETQDMISNVLGLTPPSEEKGDQTTSSSTMWIIILIMIVFVLSISSSLSLGGIFLTKNKK